MREREQRAVARVLVHRGFVHVRVGTDDVMIRELLRVDDLARLLARVRGLRLVMAGEQPDTQQRQRGRNGDDAFLQLCCKNHGPI